jgi:polysaccharide biosynthesis protein PslH
VRTLVVAEQYPWPAIDGYRRRLDHMIRGLASVGEVEVVSMRRPGTPEPELPDFAGVTAEAVPGARVGRWFPEWVRSDAPRRILWPDWTAVRSHMAPRLMRGEQPIDLVWYSHVDTWWAIHDLFGDMPAIVDFDNLENLALRLRRRVPPRFSPEGSGLDHVRTIGRWATSRGFDLVDERRWDRAQQDCASQVDHVVVCSELDLQRSGCTNAVVIGNGADAPAEVVFDRSGLQGDAPTLLFVGALDYEPNTEAVEWFVREVLPLLRPKVPDVRVRIVGRGAEHVAWVAHTDNVDLVGEVERVEPELLRSDAAIVPIRVGAGTRLKVVEALANHLPLVTTSVGCEGIDVGAGVDALIADDAATFAAACAEVLTDGMLRQRLADQGAELFSSRYDWERIRRDVGDLALHTVERARR